MPCRSTPSSPLGILHPDKDSASLSGFPALIRYIGPYLIFVLIELSSALSLGKCSSLDTLIRKRLWTPQART